MSDKVVEYLGLVLGWGLIGVGALVVLRALVWDRSRGRRRCPRCWYAMEGVLSRTCPECGRTARKEWRLFRTRRRWRRAGAGVMVGVLGVVGLYAAGAIRVGWVKALPTSVLVVVCPIATKDWKGVNGLSFSRLMSGPIAFTRSLTPMPVQSPDWRKAMLDELKARVDGDRIREWQAHVLVGRIKAAAAAEGEAIGVFDCGDRLRAEWWPMGKEISPSSGIAISKHARDVLPPSTQPLEEILAGFPFEWKTTENRIRRRMAVLSARAGGSSGSWSRVGHVVIWWEADSADAIGEVLRSLQEARPGAPVAVDKEDWDSRVMMFRHLSAIRIDLPERFSLKIALDTVAMETGLPMRIDWESMRAAGVDAEINRFPTSRSGSADEVLRQNLGWVSDLSMAVIRWDIGPEGIEIHADPSPSFSERDMRSPLVRAYDVRGILRGRFLRTWPLDAVLEENRLMMEVRIAGQPRISGTFPCYMVNGRIIANAEFSMHVAIEEYLDACAASPDGRAALGE